MIAPWYVMAYTKLERLAWRHGYCLALHGSMTRDLDLIAIPWTDDADRPEKILASFKRFIINKAKVSFSIGKPNPKPHGRQAYVLPIGYEGHYIDLSIMPRLTENNEERINTMENEAEKVLHQMQETLEALRKLKPEDRSEQARRIQITITEYEKVIAYYITYVLGVL